MSEISKLAQLNVEVANTIDSREGSFDFVASELLMRNVAVITDRQPSTCLSQLPAATVNRLLEAGDRAKWLAPLSDQSLNHLPGELDLDKLYRISVWEPLHELRSRLSSAEFKPYLYPELASAVKLGTVAFAALLIETSESVETTQSIPYFWGNTHAALARMTRLNDV